MAIMDEEQRKEFARELEMNLAISINNVGRFRINIFKQRNEISIVARNINTEIPQFDNLGFAGNIKRSGDGQARLIIICRRHRLG